jgi:hypothetical protein
MRIEAFLYASAHVAAISAAAVVSTLGPMSVRSIQSPSNGTTDATANIDNELVFGSGVLFVSAGLISLIGTAMGIIAAYRNCTKTNEPRPAPARFTVNPIYQED